MNWCDRNGRFLKGLGKKILHTRTFGDFGAIFKTGKTKFFLNNFILHFRDFQHTFINNTNFNNFLTNKSINNCFSASFTPSSLKVERRCYALAEKE